MRWLVWLGHAVMLLSTVAFAYDFYHHLHFVLPPWFNWFVYGGVFGISFLWALLHVIGGGLCGAASGGVLSGMQLGLLLGLGLSLGRLWPYIAAFAGAAFLCGAPAWHVWASAVLASICLAVYVFMTFFWEKVHLG